MIRTGLAALAIFALVGCSESSHVDNPFATNGKSEAAQEAAYAASRQYPSMHAMDDLRATALVNRKDGTVRIINASNQALLDATVWVNGAFVSHVSSIPPHGSVSIDRGAFYDARGNSMSTMNTSATAVQVETGGKFYNLQGPVFE